MFGDLGGRGGSEEGGGDFEVARQEDGEGEGRALRVPGGSTPLVQLQVTEETSEIISKFYSLMICLVVFKR